MADAELVADAETLTRLRSVLCPVTVLLLGGVTLIVACPVPGGREHLGRRADGSPFSFSGALVLVLVDPITDRC